MEYNEAWEINAEFWDQEMGDESNYFHRDIVRPYTEHLLAIKKNDFVLDIACGNGNFSQRMAHQGAKVIAFDYSPKMIKLAKKRRYDILECVDFQICDATNKNALLALGTNFDKAVANMAIMDISEINPLFEAVFEMLKNQGIFVFATCHPCFTYPNNNYFTPCVEKGFAIEGQPVLHNYYRRSLGDILNTAFECGFVCDGFYEVPFKGKKKPIIMIVRLRK